MVVKNTKTKARAKEVAKQNRKKGFEASVFKKEKGYGVSVTRKK